MKMSKLRAGSKFGECTLRGNAPIGRGGNGIVWRAINAVGKPCAIKVLLPRAYDFNVRYRRFQREVQAQRALTDRAVRGVLPLLDAHCPTQPSKSDPPWLGTPLAKPLSVYRAERELPLRESVEIVAGLSETLQIVHQYIGAHRDIKPENIFLLDGVWRIGDFGLINVSAETRLTVEGERIGAAFYCAPEMLNDSIRYDGIAGDVYSLAKMLWTIAAKQNYPLQGVLGGVDKIIDAGIDA